MLPGVPTHGTWLPGCCLPDFCACAQFLFRKFQHLKCPWHFRADIYILGVWTEFTRLLPVLYAGISYSLLILTCFNASGSHRHPISTWGERSSPWSAHWATI
jgi:hypothetical protein